MEVLRQVFAVLFVFALLGGMLWALRRRGTISFRGVSRPARGRSLESIERLALTPQHSLHLVRIHGREVVIAAHPHGCALLIEGVDRLSEGPDRKDS